MHWVRCHTFDIDFVVCINFVFWKYFNERAVIVQWMLEFFLSFCYTQKMIVSFVFGMPTAIMFDAIFRKPVQLKLSVEAPRSMTLTRSVVWSAECDGYLLSSIWLRCSMWYVGWSMIGWDFISWHGQRFFSNEERAFYVKLAISKDLKTARIVIQKNIACVIN